MSTTTDSATVQGYVLPPGEGERIWIVGDTMSIKATAASTGGSITFLDVEVGPGGGPPPHIHSREEESFYVLDGEFEFLIGEELITGGPGTFAFVPRDTVHRFRYAGDEGRGRLLITFSPGGMDGFFRESGRPAVDDGPAPPLDDDEIARTEAAGERYGVRVVDWAA